METLRSGMVARYETLRSGLVPCKVVSIVLRDGIRVITVKVTRRHYPYDPGNIIETTARHVVPLKSIRRTKYATFIRPFHVQEDR